MFSHRNDSRILGPDNANVPRLLGIIGDVVAYDVLENDAQVLQRLLAIARHVQVPLLLPYPHIHAILIMGGHDYNSASGLMPMVTSAHGD